MTKHANIPTQILVVYQINQKTAESSKSILKRRTSADQSFVHAPYILSDESLQCVIEIYL